MAVAGLAAVVGCAGTGDGRRAELAWRSAVMARGVQPSAAIYPFLATGEMRRWAEEAAGPGGDDLDRLMDLQRALFDPNRFGFQYDSGLTVNAREAFELRRGNCLSFTALFIALGRSLGIDLRLVSVQRVLEVSEEENLVVINRHVVAGFPRGSRLYGFDFFRTATNSYTRHRVVDDVTASALFHVNLGAEAIREGDLRRGLAELRKATALDPDLAAGWINLGVARRMAGDLEGALRAYHRALTIVPGDPAALTNLAHIYHAQGMEEEARTALLAAAKGPASPYSLIALAEMEAGQGRVGDAKRYLLRARRRYRSTPEVWEALARLARDGGHLELAGRYSRKAEALRRRAARERTGELEQETRPR